MVCAGSGHLVCWLRACGDIELDLHKGNPKSVESGAGRALVQSSLFALQRRLMLIPLHDAAVPAVIDIRETDASKCAADERADRSKARRAAHLNLTNSGRPIAKL